MFFPIRIAEESAGPEPKPDSNVPPGDVSPGEDNTDFGIFKKPVVPNADLRNMDWVETKQHDKEGVEERSVESKTSDKEGVVESEGDKERAGDQAEKEKKRERRIRAVGRTVMWVVTEDNK